MRQRYKARPTQINERNIWGERHGYWEIEIRHENTLTCVTYKDGKREGTLYSITPDRFIFNKTYYSSNNLLGNSITYHLEMVIYCNPFKRIHIEENE